MDGSAPPELWIFTVSSCIKQLHSTVKKMSCLSISVSILANKLSPYV